MVSDKKGFSMKCLSIQQPMAWAICVGDKTVENKFKNTSHRGPLLIHAGKKAGGLSKIKELPGWDKYKDSFAFGAIIGAVDLYDCVDFNSSLESNPHASGPICYLLKNPRWFEEPIPGIGQLGIFNLPDNLTAKVEKQLQKPGRSAKVPDDLLEAVRPAPSNLCFDQGTTYWENGEFKDALRRLDEAISLCKANAVAFFYRGLTHDSLGNLKNAVQDLSEAIKLDDQRPLFFYHRGLCLRHLKRLPESSQDFTRLIELEPGETRGYILRGQNRHLVKDTASAISDLKKTQKLDPENDEAKALMGIVLVDSGKTADGVKTLKGTVDEDPQAPWPIFFLHWAYKKAKQPELAKKALARFKKMDGDEDGAREYLAELGIDV